MSVVNNKKLKILRDELKYSQKKFAEQLEISYSEYQKLEKGLVPNPGINMIYTIARRCKVNIDWLCDLSDIRFSEDAVDLMKELRDKPGIVKKLLNIFKNEDHSIILMVVLELLSDRKKIMQVKDMVVVN